MNAAKLSAVDGSIENGSSLYACSTRTIKSSGIPAKLKPLIDVVLRMPCAEGSKRPKVSIVVERVMTPVSLETTIAGPVAVSKTESLPEWRNFELLIMLY